MGKTKRFTLLRAGIALVSLVFFSAFVYFFNTVSEFYKAADNCSGAISRGDQIAAREALKDLEFFYSKKLELSRFRLGSVGFLPDEWVDKHIFRKAQVKYYVPAYDFLTANHEKVINELKDDDGYWACYMRANSRWRQAQGIFRQSLTEKDPKIKTDMHKLAVETVLGTKDDYEQAIIKDPNSSLPPKWNYDLTTDPAAMMRGLMPKPIKVKVMLGEGDDGQGPDGDDGDGPKGKGNRDLDKKKGEKSDSNKSGSKREG